MKIILRTALCLSIIFLCGLPIPVESAPASSSQIKKGVWVSVVGEEDLFGSSGRISELVSFAKTNGINRIFIQVYRGDKAWFNSHIADSSPYKHNHTLTGIDGLQVLIRKAHKEGIQIHAWINTLSLSQNEKAPLLEKYGSSILTKDQHGHISMRSKPPDKWDIFYGKEDQLFLEPGDPRVQQHVTELVKEIVTTYPDLDGIHFDYIRYPASPPYIPGSRFKPIGLVYGYGEANVRRFTQATGLDPLNVDWKVKEAHQWDEWRRDQVTHLLTQAAFEARRLNSRIQISCAALNAFDRAYSSACQDWARWIREGIVDFIVLMNYSTDSRFVNYISSVAIGLAGDPRKVYIGLGAYLMTESPQLLGEQIRETAALHPGGIVFFDYQVMSKSPLKELLSGQ